MLFDAIVRFFDVASCCLMQNAGAGAHIKALESPVQGVVPSSQPVARPATDPQARMRQLADAAQADLHSE